MDHETVTTSHAVERYLLSEMPPEEREEFEQHFFECDACAEEVSSGNVFIANARAVFAEDEKPHPLRAAEVPVAKTRWFGFLRPAWGLAAAGAIVFFGLFQVAQRVPFGVTARQVGPIVLSPGETRGESERAVYRPGDTLVVRLEIEQKDAPGPHVIELRDAANGDPISEVKAEITPDDLRTGKEVKFLGRNIPTDRRYVIVIRRAEDSKPGKEVDRYYLKLDSK